MTPHEQFSEPQVEEIPQDDVVDKVDQFLNRHRAGPAVVGDSQASPGASENGMEMADDAIPTLTDIVSTANVPANRRAGSNPAAIDDGLILRRLEVTLDMVRTRVESQIGGDAEQTRLLDQLFAVLKLTLPDAVRSTGTGPVVDSAQPGGRPRL